MNDYLFAVTKTNGEISNDDFRSISKQIHEIDQGVDLNYTREKIWVSAPGYYSGTPYKSNVDKIEKIISDAMN